ncbi:head decoration protein [Ruegeria arenilitoris]|uniref:head decoration protein n=1 Tax=Ruegeria arenilitoris TaxID=1173585 RepID=UPI00147FE6EF|nr:head decoration protein [Ruegeria arenilitoris]
MTTLTEGKTPGDFLLFEENSQYSRDLVTIGSGANLEPGTVLGQITATKKFVASVETANDGSEVAVAVLRTPAPAENQDVEAVIQARHTTVRRGGLTWHSSYDNEAKRDAAVAELKQQGIIAN